MERWEIEKAMEIYKKYDVTVISDEIWSDIILYGNEHIQPSLYLKMQETERLLYTHHPIPSTSRIDRKPSYYNTTNALKDRVLKRVLHCHWLNLE